MKKLLLYLQLCLFALVIASCSDDDNEEAPKVSPPTVSMSVAALQPTEVSVKFTLTNTAECRWMMLEEEKDLPDMEKILNEGHVLNLKSDSVITMTNLKGNSNLTFVAAAKGPGGSTMATPLMVTTPKDENADVLQTDVLIEATYRNDNKIGAGQYGVILSNAEPSASGDPANVGDFQVFLDLYNEADADPLNAVLPAGEYLPDNTLAPFTWNPAKCIFCVRTAEGNDGITAMPFVDGTVTVKQVEGGYDVLVVASLLSGESVKVHYAGDLQFVQTGTSNERFDKDQNVTFEKAGGLYYGNWFRYFCDDMNLEFYTGEKDENGKIVDGYYLSVPAFMDKLADPYTPDVRLQEGTYRILDRQLTSQNTVPMIIQKGEHVELFGDYYDVGTYLTYHNGTNGQMQLGICKEGTMVVKHVGSGYKIDFDLTTEEGHKITGVYEGELHLKNHCDNKDHEPVRPWSTLPADRVLNIPADAVAEAYLMGDYIQPGINVWMLVVSPTETSTPGDMFTTELFTEGDTFDFGTYEVKKAFQPFCALPGFIEYAGQPLYSWVGDLANLDDEGYAQTLAPIAEGTMVYSQEGDAQKFVFDMLDDAGHKVTGSWTGTVKTFDVREEMNGGPTATKQRILNHQVQKVILK